MSDKSGNKKTAERKAALLTALEMYHGVVSTACRAAKISRDTYYRWHKEDEAFRAAADEMQEVALDHVESKLFDQINSGDTTAIIFYLRTKGKKRGYFQSANVEFASDGSNVSISLFPASERDDE